MEIIAKEMRLLVKHQKTKNAADPNGSGVMTLHQKPMLLIANLSQGVSDGKLVPEDTRPH